MIYSSLIHSKTGDAIPLFLDGKPMHSKYNPSAERLPAGPEAPPAGEGFFLIGGIGGGYHIANLIRQLKNYCVVAFEADKESLDFCLALPGVRTLAQNPRVFFCQACEARALLQEKYIAALYGDFRCLFQRAWQQENRTLCRNMEAELEATLKEVSADFSVQAHFGKIWMHNILINLRQFGGGRPVSLAEGALGKCAAVIAAGPTLDRSIARLQELRNDCFIIATDTTTGPLYRQGIVPDAIVCVDAQQVSSEHFYPLPPTQEGRKSPLVFLDLCAAPSSVRMLCQKGVQPVFFHSGHPLALLAAQECGLMQVETGSGTVTIAAADIARQLGFRRLRFFGADFSYRDGKPYTKGSYLDARFHGTSSALLPAEQQFAALMYRTPLREQQAGVFTSEVLAGYGKSLEAWEEKHGYTKKLDELYCETAEKREGNGNLPFDFASFMKNSVCTMGNSCDSSALYTSKAFYALLPYVAYLRQHPDRIATAAPSSGESGKAQDTARLLMAAYQYACSFAE